ncbi:hypothetical protein Patl1_30117 [Pistacia atlantica]|uniref:Uncharacterized protein n=1 Tax=Pistacia atlantica TaxID=434234 RepID=A0ACC1A9H2_9ROSI|nr:hypothetical protein Patl1_30117 [Pistacia atlantica]
MKKTLDTRFPAARRKKIMQADKDIGKMALAVPLLVSKALELFLQDLCDQTYGITLKRGAKTMNSLHLKQSVETFNVFDFLREIVSKVPDLGGSDTAGDERSVAKRRKVDGEDTDDDEAKRSRMEIGRTSSSSRGRGRGRGRGRERGSQTVERDISVHYEKFEDDLDISDYQEKNNPSRPSLERSYSAEEPKSSIPAGNIELPIRNFDLNVDLQVNSNSTAMPAPAPWLTTEIMPKVKHEEYPGWSLFDIKKMAVDPHQLASLNRRTDEDEEDYDEKG